MSEQKTKKITENNDTEPSRKNQTWMERNLPTLVGGGTFGLLILLTLAMYLANN